MRMVEEQGPQNWNGIARSITGRTGKQCRERWLTKLSPAYRTDAWTSEEDAILARLQAVHGNQWVRFRAQIPHRSTISIKNRWVSLGRRQRREAKARTPLGAGDGDAPIITMDDEILPPFWNFDSQFAFDDLSWGT
jgi:hypothetical protein